MSGLADQVNAVAEAAAARQTDGWEILAVDRRETTIDVGSGEPDAIGHADETTLCLRVYRDGRVGTATTTQPAEIRAVVDDAVLAAGYGPFAEWQGDDDPGPGETGRADRVGGRDTAGRAGETGMAVAGGGTTQAVGGVRAVAGELGALQHETGLTLHGTVSHAEQTVHRAAPGNLTTAHHRFFRLSVLAEGAANLHLQLPWTGWTCSATLPGGLRDWLFTAAPWDRLPTGLDPTGEPDLLLSPSAVHTLLTPLVTALGGSAATTGRSFLAGQLGTPLLHPSLSLIDRPPAEADGDDGTAGLAWPGTDDEGVPCAPLTLVENGVPVRLYHSRSTAAVVGSTPTGHAFRGNALRRTMLRPATPVLNGVTLLTKPAGTGAVADLVGEIEDGILIESLLGGQQRSGLSPIVEGRIRLGFVIRRGRVVGTLRPCAVALDLREVFGDRFVAAGDQRWAVSRIWSARLPFVLASGG